MSESKLEAELAFALRAVGLPEPVREYHFDWCCEHTKREHRIAHDGWPWCRVCLANERTARVPSQHHYEKGRDWRFDFSWPDRMVAVEVDGGTYSGGRHVRPGGFAADAEKLNAAALKGWKVLRFDRKQVKDGTALNTIEAALK